MDIVNSIWVCEAPSLYMFSVQFFFEKHALWHVLSAVYKCHARVAPVSTREQLLNMDVNNYGKPLSDEERAAIDEMASFVYTDEQGEEHNYLTEEELDDLHIKAGTLSDRERVTMQSHVVHTDKILSHVHFNEEFNRVRQIASNHHELLNGKGYPSGLAADELDAMTRILTIMDIFDSLIADDRPYKKPKSVKAAFEILDEEAEAGKVDKELLDIARELYGENDSSAEG